MTDELLRHHLTQLFWAMRHQLARFDTDYPYERCGFIVRNNAGYLSLREVSNAHDEATDRFRITLRAFQSVQGEIWGVFHTHPGRSRDGWVPSPQDHAGAAIRTDIKHVVYHPFTRRLTLFNGAGVVGSARIRLPLKLHRLK